MDVRVSKFSTGLPHRLKSVQGKYLKKLIGKTDMEDALRKLDMLTNEEARMATAQVLKVTHAVDDRVASVDGKMKAVDDKVAVVIDGVLPSPISHRENFFNCDVSRGEGSKGGHTTDCKRHGSSETFVILSVLTLVLGVQQLQLKRPHREPITTGPSQMALSAGPVY